MSLAGDCDMHAPALRMPVMAGAGIEFGGISVTRDGRSAALENSVCGDYLHCLRTLATVEGFARLTHPTKGACAHDLEADLHEAEAFPCA